jgi:serine protease AprX
LRWSAAIVAVAVLLDTAWTPSEAASKSVPSRMDPALLAQARSHPTSSFDVIVQVAPQTTKLAPNAKADTADRAGKAAVRAGGVPHRALGFIGGASATVKGAQLVALAADPDVSYVYADVGLSAKFDPQGGAAAATGPGLHEVNAPAAWTTYGVTGRGVGVAIVDSGIYAHPDLAGRIVASVDFTNSTGSSNTSGDPGGHGTHVAGLVAGDGTASGGAFTGVAPGANLIDVRVIDGNGASNVSTVLAGLGWVLANRDTYNIRVVNMSLGSPEQAGYATGPLSAAVEVLWFAGITVVVSAGNSGPGASTITTPGDDPFVITVGAIDDNGTSTLVDDAAATWSSNGPTTFDRLAKPDLVAPGRRMISLRSPGSALDRAYPERDVTAPGAATADYFMLSGTSMAAPMVTGAVALMLERQPTLTPRQVKQRLVSTVTPLAFGTIYIRGAGMLDALAAVASTDTRSWRDKSRVSDGFAQIVYPLIFGRPIPWASTSFNGGTDSNGIPWASVNWSDISWDTVTWEDISWEDISWEGISWGSIAAQDISWEMTFEPLSGGPGWTPVN